MIGVSTWLPSKHLPLYGCVCVFLLKLIHKQTLLKVLPGMHVWELKVYFENDEQEPTNKNSTPLISGYHTKLQDTKQICWKTDAFNLFWNRAYSWHYSTKVYTNCWQSYKDSYLPCNFCTCSYKILYVHVPVRTKSVMCAPVNTWDSTSVLTLSVLGFLQGHRVYRPRHK